MVLSDPVDRLMRAALLSDEEFVQALNHIMKQELRISVRELSSRSGIAQSSLYKILHGKRSPNISTLRSVVHALRLFEKAGEGEFIGLIAARPVLDIVRRNAGSTGAGSVSGIPRAYMEDAIVAASGRNAGATLSSVPPSSRASSSNSSISR
jgi:predicted transcriptional regulator